jgi:hypothetical protein
MLNQTFSTENFWKIFEIENRKGRFEKTFFSKDFFESVLKLQDKNSEIKEYRRKKNYDKLEFHELMKEKRELKKIKERILRADLTGISKAVNEKAFTFLIHSFIPENDEKGKVIYSFRKDDSASFFAIKHLQLNISRIFSVKQSNRYHIVKQVKTSLQDNFPKYIVRTDIRNFYESIPQDRLLKLINENPILSSKSKELISKLFYSFNDLSNQLILPPTERKGVPRGIGVSAYLAELYLREIDFEINKLSGINYFARFVDDIIIFFNPESNDTQIDHLSEIRTIVESFGLALKDGTIPDEENKTFKFNSRQDCEFNFLGYKFILKDGKFLNILLTENKKLKYKTRIEKTLDQFLIDSKFNSTHARQLLIHRLNYLTKNTRLFHPKIGLIGIYYSNSLIENNCPCLDELDDNLKVLIDQKIPVELNEKLNQRLKRYSFKSGFINREFFNIESKRKNIPDSRPISMKLKKNRINNFERIISAWK